MGVVCLHMGPESVVVDDRGIERYENARLDNVSVIPAPMFFTFFREPKNIEYFEEKLSRTMANWLKLNGMAKMKGRRKATDSYLLVGARDFQVEGRHGYENHRTELEISFSTWGFTLLTMNQSTVKSMEPKDVNVEF